MTTLGTRLVCVDVRPEEVSAILVAGRRVVSWATIPHNPAHETTEALSDRLRTLFKTWGALGARARMTIADDAVLLRRVQLPQMGSRDRRRAVRFTFEREMPFPDDRSARGWAFIPRPTGGRDVLMAGAWRDVVERMTRVATEAGLNVVRVEPRSVCVARALHSADAVVVEAQGGRLHALHVGALPAVAESIPLPSDENGLKDGIETVLRATAQRLPVRPSDRQSRVVVAGEMEALTGSLGFPAEPASALLNGSGPRRPIDFPAGSHLAALGLATAANGPRGIPVLNLSVPRPRRRLPRPGRAELLIGVIAVLVWSAVGYGVAVAAGFASLPLGP